MTKDDMKVVNKGGFNPGPPEGVEPPPPPPPRRIVGRRPVAPVVELPLIQLQVRGHVFEASGSDPVQWSIYAEALLDPSCSARTHILVNNERMADVTIHSPGGDIELVQEVQEVSAALVWSAIRS